MPTFISLKKTLNTETLRHIDKHANLDKISALFFLDRSGFESVSKKTVIYSVSLCLCVLTALFTLGMITPLHAAEPAGKVTHVSGSLGARKADGSIKFLSINSPVEEGDMLVTEKRTYARIKFRDNSEITLKPTTQFKVEQFSHSKDRPADDKAAFNLIKGGLRAVTGQIGKRGDPDSYRMKTPTATIGIRGTNYGATFCMADCGKLPSGLYVDVAAGKIVVSNQGGSQTLGAGQFGHVPSATIPPVILPKNPGVSTFTPPPSMSGPAKGASGPTGGGQVKGGDCEVR